MSENACFCDTFVHPADIFIPAGLSVLPRQIATFPEFRTAMLACISTHYPLSKWNARKEDDLGVMLLEMWAYICDSLTFYDKVFAQELFLRTAQEKNSVTGLINLLGYIPRPAISSTASLYSIAEGTQTITLPEGTAFRSGAFDDESPQIFELDSESSVLSFSNKWSIKPVIYPNIKTTNPNLLYTIPSSEIKEDALVLLKNVDSINASRGLKVKSTEVLEGIDEKNYTEVTFQTNIQLSGGEPTNALSLQAPSYEAVLWTIVTIDSSTGNVIDASVETTSSYTKITLDKVYPGIESNQTVLIRKDEEYRTFQLTEVSQVTRTPNEETTATINGHSYNIPSLAVPCTQIKLDVSINDSSRKVSSSSIDWIDDHRAQLTVYFGFSKIAEITNLPEEKLYDIDPLELDGVINETIDTTKVYELALVDYYSNNHIVKATFEEDTNSIKLGQGEGWETPLQMPVEAYGNIISVSRGETITNEILGTGDATVSNQQFTLKKKPLSYFLDSTAKSGVKNTLEVYVDGLKWKEVMVFYNIGSEEEVYIVRQDEEENSIVTFGDGKRGRRLPTGAQVIAYYRFGAGKASPPSGIINQIANPVEGLNNVYNPLAATGGEDAELAENIRKYAPASILVLGRAVSIEDMVAIAQSIPGVRRAQASWEWNKQKQRPMVSIWYIGEDYLEAKISESLRNMCDPSTPIIVNKASEIPVSLTIDIGIYPDYISEDIIENVTNVLTSYDNSILKTENQQIGFPFYRSKLFAEILTTEGAISVSSVYWNNNILKSFAKRPNTGHYFDFEKGELTVTTHTIILA